jgi:bacteriorhodopsin
MGNDALRVNGKLLAFQCNKDGFLTTLPDDAVNNAHAHIAITVRGSDWYWAVTAIMITATIAFIGLAATKPRQHRIFHYITAAITMVASIAYFSMASNLGWTGIAVEFVRNDPKVAGAYREIFYGKT